MGETPEVTQASKGYGHIAPAVLLDDSYFPFSDDMFIPISRRIGWRFAVQVCWSERALYTHIRQGQPSWVILTPMLP